MHKAGLQQRGHSPQRGYFLADDAGRDSSHQEELEQLLLHGHCQKASRVNCDEALKRERPLRNIPN